MNLQFKWMCKKPPPTVNFDLPPTTPGPVFNSSNTCSFVKMLECDFIHFIVACTIAIGEVPGPLFDFSCVNKSVTVSFTLPINKNYLTKNWFLDLALRRYFY